MAPVHSVNTCGRGHSYVQDPAGSDSISRAQDSVTGRLVDSVVVRSPLPDPLVPIVQWIFQRPSWVMVGGLVLVAIVAARAAGRCSGAGGGTIGNWLVTRDRGVKLALGARSAPCCLLIVGGGREGERLRDARQRFLPGLPHLRAQRAAVRPARHRDLSAGQQAGGKARLALLSLPATRSSSRPRARSCSTGSWSGRTRSRRTPRCLAHVCERCHVKGEAKKTWQRIASTAGHRTHLESDSSALKDVQCLTCHARTAHRFQPADTTCAQKGCHLTDEVKIQLGRMAARFDPAQVKPLPNEEQLYCNSCHQFTAEAQFVSLDSAAGTLRPGDAAVLRLPRDAPAAGAASIPTKDPHGGSCGMCHNPHTDVKPKDALKSCADAACHANWRSVPFHVGAAHRKVAQRCETCHQPHAARVDASDCTGCHEEVRKGGDACGRRCRSTPPRRCSRRIRSGRAGARAGPRRRAAAGRSPGSGAPPPALPADTFSHQRHRRLACITCHTTTSPKSTLTSAASRLSDLPSPASGHDASAPPAMIAMTSVRSTSGPGDGAAAQPPSTRGAFRACRARKGRLHPVPYSFRESRSGPAGQGLRVVSRRSPHRRFATVRRATRRVPSPRRMLHRSTLTPAAISATRLRRWRPSHPHGRFA